MRTYDGLGSMNLLPLGDLGSLKINKTLKDLSLLRDDNDLCNTDGSARSGWIRQPCCHFCLVGLL
jgi:hypothetical protein